MGLPVLSMAGRAFAARTGTSLLTAVGLPECIAQDRRDYLRRAIAIAQPDGRGPILHGPALARRWQETLGDAAGFTRRFEAMLERIVLR